MTVVIIRQNKIIFKKEYKIELFKITNIEVRALIWPNKISFQKRKWSLRIFFFFSCVIHCICILWFTAKELKLLYKLKEFLVSFIYIYIYIYKQFSSHFNHLS